MLNPFLPLASHICAVYHDVWNDKRKMYVENNAAAILNENLQFIFKTYKRAIKICFHTKRKMLCDFLSALFSKKT